MENTTPLPDGLLVVPRDPADPRVDKRGDGELKHSPTCRMAFGKLDPDNCARCIELTNHRVVGIPPRADYAAGRRGQQCGPSGAEITAHFRSEKHARECGPGGSWCTFGQW